VDPKTPIDDPDDEVPPANPRRRRAVTMFGCLFALALLGILIWFGVLHLGTADEPGWFGGWGGR
jgi:hypothetical protein